MAGGDGARHEYRFPFVCLEEHYYLAEPQVLARLAGDREGGLRARITGRDGSYALTVVSSESPLQETVSLHYMEKYERSGQAFVRLSPTADD